MADLVKSLRQAGIAKHKAGEFKAALALYARAMTFAPDDAETLTNMGVILRQTKQFHEALALQRRAIGIAPENRAIRVNCANILEDTGHHDEAADLRRSLLEDEPNSSPNQALLARSLRNAGRVDEARALLDTYLAGDDPGPELRLEHGILQLSCGHYAEGFRHYLARREAKLVDLPEVNLPRWTGQPLKEKRVLFLPEQGMGDTINFVRFLPYLKERGAEVHLITRPPMHRLLQTLPEADAVLSEPVKGAGYHYWTSGLDVPVDYFHFRDDVPHPCAPRRLRTAENGPGCSQRHMLTGSRSVVSGMVRKAMIAMPCVPCLMGSCGNLRRFPEFSSFRSTRVRRWMPISQMAAPRPCSIPPARIATWPTAAR